MTSQTYTFENQAAAEEFFSVLSYARLPIRAQDTRGAHGYDDEGRAIVTFARKLFGQPEAGVSYSLTEARRHVR